MFDRVIRFSLRNRLLVVAAAVALMIYGGFVVKRLPVDVFPDLNRPTVSIMTEAGGLSPEEVEQLVTTPIESAMNGAPGVRRVRSSSGVGLSIVHVEFDWSTDLHLDRQLVTERLAAARERLPREVQPTIPPLSSIMGEIMLLGVESTDGKTPPSELRALADWEIRRRLLAIPGVAQVAVMGGGVKQYQVLIDPRKLLEFGLTLAEVEDAARRSQGNATGGFLDRKSQEYLVRIVARSSSVDDLADTVVGWREGVAIRLRQVAAVQLGTGVKRGDAGVNGAPAVILAVQKQPGASTVGLTRTVERALADLSRSLPADVRVVPLFRQATFIETAIGSVVEALRDGAILVVIVLCIFLFSLRTTVITLTAIPLSFLVTAVVLSAFHLSVNTMTLGGLAVAIGELVDDAIVDVENVYRRLRENRAREKPEPILAVIYRASSEVRNSIVFATIIVVLVFLPLFALGGIEGRLFAPLGVAYIVSILASLVVSLTVTPALCSYLLPNASFLARSDSFVVRWLKAQDRKLLDVTLAHPWKVMIGAGLLVAAAACVVPFLGREFMPPFNEGSATIHVTCVPGTSLDESNRVGQAAERLLLSVSEVASVGRRTGRAEQDEHAEGVHASEIDVDFKKSGGRPRAVVLDEIRRRLTQLPGVAVNIGQPISHRLDHLLSGVRAQIAVKLFGPDLPTLRSKARELQQAMAKVDGIVDLQIEQQTLIPQLVIRLKRDEAARYGIQSGAMAELLETAIGGHTVAQILDGPRAFDVVVRYDARSRADRDALARTLVDTPSGAKVPLGAFAEVREDLGPNLINHDDVTRRIVVMANARHRDLGSVVAEVKRRIDADVKLPTGYWIAYEGQFESQQSATRLIGLLSLASLAGMFLVLFGHFRSLRLVLQVMLNIPLALVGSVAAILLTDGTFSIATLVGFVTLCGIASRNTIMMISHYRELQREGAPFDRALVVRGSLERLVPVLMTALTAALALVPLVLARGQPGKEILYPVATVILGGLVSSTLLDMVVTPAVFFKFGKPAPDSDDPERI